MPILIKAALILGVLGEGRQKYGRNWNEGNLLDFERSNPKCGFRIMSNGYMKYDASHSEVMHIPVIPF